MSSYISFSIAGADGAALKKKIQDLALSRGISVSELVTEAVVEYLRKLKNGERPTSQPAAH